MRTTFTYLRASSLLWLSIKDDVSSGSFGQYDLSLRQLSYLRLLERRDFCPQNGSQLKLIFDTVVDKVRLMKAFSPIEFIALGVVNKLQSAELLPVQRGASK